MYSTEEEEIYPIESINSNLKIPMNTISAKELKCKGVSAFGDQDETFITVRGKIRFVVMNIATYEDLREAELEATLIQTKNDIVNGKFIVESVVEYIKRIFT